MRSQYANPGNCRRIDSQDPCPLLAQHLHRHLRSSFLADSTYILVSRLFHLLPATCPILSWQTTGCLQPRIRCSCPPSCVAPPSTPPADSARGFSGSADANCVVRFLTSVSISALHF